MCRGNTGEMSNIPEIELQSPERIRDFQFAKLKELILYLEVKSPYYKKLFIKGAMSSTRVSSWSDFHSLPTTSKDDLQQNNWDFLCVPKSDIVEYTSTSGTLGKPVTIALTKKDIERLKAKGVHEFQIDSEFDRWF